MRLRLAASSASSRRTASALACYGRRALARSQRRGSSPDGAQRSDPNRRAHRGPSCRNLSPPDLPPAQHAPTEPDVQWAGRPTPSAQRPVIKTAPVRLTCSTSAWSPSIPVSRGIGSRGGLDLAARSSTCANAGSTSRPAEPDATAVTRPDGPSTRHSGTRHSPRECERHRPPLFYLDGLTSEAPSAHTFFHRRIARSTRRRSGRDA